jgi:hypothetical protein
MQPDIYIPQPVPESHRSIKLKAYLRNWAEHLVSIRKGNPELLKGVNLPFHYLCYFWLVPTEQRNSSVTQTFTQVQASGFEGERIGAELNEILAEDRHLKECCESALDLAFYVDGNFIEMLINAIESGNVTDERYDHFFGIFSEFTYSQPLRKFTLSHLYNFESPEKILRFEGVSVMRLEVPEITDVIGDMSVYRFLHNHATGDCFVITQSAGECPNMVEWLFNEREIATNFLGILQYYKDGVVTIDYTTPYFLPQWVNRVRKRGLTFIGEPHRMPYANGGRFFTLSQSEAAGANRWWQISQTPLVSNKLGDLQNRLRQALLRAGEYYETSMQAKDAAARLIHLAIALEALFSPPDKAELSYKISLCASLLIGGNDRVENFNFLREMYRRRSAPFHGSYDTNKDLLTVEEAERLAGIIRLSILRFFVLYANGENSRDNILARLGDGVLNSTVLEQLRSDSDPQTFLDQFSEL